MSDKKENKGKLKDRNVGAVWNGKEGNSLFIKLDLNGITYIIKAYPNSYKKTEKQPDWQAYLEEQRKTEKKDVPTSSRPSKSEKSNPTPVQNEKELDQNVDF